MIDRLLLVAYGIAVLAATLFHSHWVLAGLLLAAACWAGSQWWQLARRALLALALFTSVVLLAYSVSALIQDKFSWHHVSLIALRVLTLTYLTFVMSRRVNLFEAFSFSKTLLYVATLATSQALTMRRMLGEFRMALRSRLIGRPARCTLLQHAGVTAAYFVEKSISDATEIAQAMRSRGFFDADG
jgi:cobalt/nickel transport system permease protein